MKLHQLRYLAAVAQSGLNITAAAHKLHTSQPGVSKQIKLLEDELGFQIFVREGRNLTRITAAGQQSSIGRCASCRRRRAFVTSPPNCGTRGVAASPLAPPIPKPATCCRT